MKVIDVSESVLVTITLTEFEVKWLRALVQNPIYPFEGKQIESPEDKRMRQLFWDILPDLE